MPENDVDTAAPDDQSDFDDDVRVVLLSDEAAEIFAAAASARLAAT